MQPRTDTRRQMVISTLLGITATVVFLWFTDYSLGGIVAVSLLWLMAVIAAVRNLRIRQHDE